MACHSRRSAASIARCDPLFVLRTTQCGRLSALIALSKLSLGKREHSTARNSTRTGLHLRDGGIVLADAHQKRAPAGDWEEPAVWISLSLQGSLSPPSKDPGRKSAADRAFVVIVAGIESRFCLAGLSLMAEAQEVLGLRPGKMARQVVRD